MPTLKTTYTVIFGGWYQRTTLHLTEIYDFLALGRSHPQLDQSRLQSLHDNLNLKSISRQAGYLEYVQAATTDDIIIRYYEDGLYILQTQTTDVFSAEKQLQNYFQSLFEPAISYIFSLGAPLPKVLANIRTDHPLVISVHTDHPEKLDLDEAKYGPVYSQISSEGVTVYKTPRYIFIASNLKSSLPGTDLMEMQIFFREFKDQLGKYLAIHRKIWEEIGDIKERQVVTGSQIGPLRARLDSYQKTVNLITNRINQMGTYVHTRSSLANQLKIEDHLKTLFEYKFEVLTNTLLYIKEIWSMTTQYLTSAIQTLRELETQSQTNSIKSLSIITSVGVVSSLVVHLTRKDMPVLTLPGIIFLILLILLTWLANLAITYAYKNFKYRLKFPNTASDI